MGLQSSWEYLSQTDLPIFIYGMGDGALKILKVFDRLGIPVAGFFASNEFVRGHSFEGHFVHELSEIEEKVEDFVIVLAFAASYSSLINRIKEINIRHKLIVPDVDVVGNGLFTKDFLKSNFDNINKMYELLSDDKSRLVYKKVLSFKITGKINYLDGIENEKDEDYNYILSLGEDETYVDLGAFNGDTVLEFLNAVNYSYRKVIALEPSKRNFKKLIKNTEGDHDINCYNAAAWDENTILHFNNVNGRQAKINKTGEEVISLSVDSVMDEQRATYIKYDVEGAEKRAILGSVNTIKKYTPSLKMALYHRSEDIFLLGLMINEINSNYKFYMRKLPYIPAWEVNLFCIN